MVASILKQAAEILHKRKNSRRWQKMILCLAIVAAAGTIMILMTTGQALTKKGKVLDCKLEVHEHTDECYDEDGELVCGYADFVIHEHNEDCYDADGNLVCTLPEIELHEHDASCYEEQRVLICEEGKNAGAGTEVNTEEEKRQDTSAGETPSHSSDGNSGSGNSNSNSGDGNGNNSGGGEVLDCGKEEHTHGDGCYETKSCDKEEHSHDDGCYDENGELTCGKDEHSHDDGCEGEVLTCDKEEHTHSGGCYSTESASEGGTETAAAENEAEATAEPDSTESKPAETDNSDINIEESNTEETTGMEENSGTEETAGTEENSGTEETAGTEENADAEESAGTEEAAGTEAAENKEETSAGHVHTEECYGEETELVLVCEELSQGLHTHVKELVEDGGCYDSSAFDEETGDFIEGSRPVCGLLQLEEHVHTKDCFTNDPDYIFTKTCEGDGFIVTAEYTGKADIPEEAELRAEMVEADSEHYAQREAEYKETLEDEHASMRALMKIGFYMDDEEIEPKDDVTITVQLLDEDGLAEGRPITVVHFAEEGAEILDGGKAENQSTTFKMGSFSEIAIGYSRNNNGTIYVSQKYAYKDDAFEITFHVDGEVVPRNADEALPENITDIISNKIHPVVIVGETVKETTVSGNDAEKTEVPDIEDNGKNEEITDSEEKTEESVDPEEKEETAEEPEEDQGSADTADKEETDAAGEDEEKAETDSADKEKSTEAAASSEEDQEAADDADEEKQEAAADADEEKQETAADADVTEQENADGSEEEDQEAAGITEKEQNTADVEKEQINNEELLQFRMSALNKGSDEYQSFLDYVEEAKETEGETKQLMLKVMGYSLFYDEIELDLSACEVTAEIVPTQELKSYVEGDAPALESFETEEEETEEEDEAVEEEMSRDVTVQILQLTDEKQVVQSAQMDVVSEDSSISVEPETAETEADQAAQMDDVQAGSEEEMSTGGLSGLFSKMRGRALQINDEPAAPETDMTESAPAEVDAEITQKSETATFTLDTKNADAQFFALRATGQPNPHFTVQYYANLDILNKTGTNALPVIDTSGKKLPANGKGTSASPNGNAIKNIYVDNSGNVQTTNTATEVYKARNFEYHKAPSINYMNALVKNPNYGLKEVWVLKGGKDPASINKGDWTIYTYSKDLHFTNRKETAEKYKDYVYIKEGTVLRFVYDTTDAKPDFKAAFYDYDITSGRMYTNVSNAINNSSSGSTQTGKQQNGTLYYVYTKAAGINSAGNYSKGGTRLAFGNVNTGTTMGENLWSGNLLNKYNGTQDGHPTVTGAYKGCTFGLVTGLKDGKIQYASGVKAPKLFNEGSATGKTSYNKDQYSLKFIRSGDTYTLTAVNGTGTAGLESFRHPSPNSSTTHTHIWTNDFWPMDSVRSYGTNGHDLKFGSYGQRNNRAYAGSSTTGEPGSTSSSKKTFPYSDDGKDHNSYFGMQYAVEFELSEDYVGPLEYYFFGDDDMWVFLDNQLVCDIGGVHSSVGEYVNLWDYLKKGSKGKHTLSFFYTERGASGSTCWMQFTLPSVSSLTPETTDDDFGHLKIGKEVMVTADGKDYPASELFKGTEQGTLFENKEFTFKLSIKDLKDDYAYIKYDRNGKPITGDGGGGVLQWELIADGEDFTLKDGEYIEIKYLPQGTKYTITESNTEIQGVVYNDTSIVQDGKNVSNPNNKFSVSGTVPKNMTSEISYTNRYTVFALPETGGPGTVMYIFAGALFIVFSAGFIYRKKAGKEAV